MKWLKDNGQEIETNDLPATVAHCKSLDWKQVKDNPDLTDEEKAAKKEAAAAKRKEAANKKAAAKKEADDKKSAE